jgi:hypothetical protein
MANADSWKSRCDLNFVFLLPRPLPGIRRATAKFTFSGGCSAGITITTFAMTGDARNAGLTKNRQGQYIDDCGSRTK